MPVSISYSELGAGYTAGRGERQATSFPASPPAVSTQQAVAISGNQVSAVSKQQ